MKILFLSEGGHTCDYMRDMTAHGLRSLLGEDFVDFPRIDTLYRDIDTSKLYGKGFSIYGLLPELPVDRTDIPKKIATRYFDIVIYGSIHRHQDYLHEVAAMYDPHRVCFIDGEDHPGYLKGLGGIYMKRELYNPQPGVWPIEFAIPKEKILPDLPVKKRMMAPCDPIDRNTYVYSTEADYYAQYAESYYGATMKKAGWCCLRHYEMMANWCIPYFRCFDQCPTLIMERLPRREIRLVQECIDYRGNGKSYSRLSDSALEDVYANLIDRVMKVLSERLTTEALATYILDTIGVRAKETVLCA